jgi:pimeloyl-ACP methyl ester carboxylesterase
LPNGKITMKDSLWSAVDEEAGQRMIKTAAAVDAWVTADRMLYGTYPFDEAGSREIAVQQVRRASNILSHRFNHPIAVDRTPSWRHRMPEVQVPALIIHGTEDAALPQPMRSLLPMRSQALS